MLTDTKLRNLNTDWIEKCLAHEQKGMRAVYNKAEYRLEILAAKNLEAG